MYTKTWTFLNKSLEWACENGVALRVGLLNAARRRYNLECVILAVTQDGLNVRCMEQMALADLVNSDCLLYVDSAPQDGAASEALAAKAGVFLCQTRVKGQGIDKDGHVLLALEGVKRFDFRELRKHRRASPSSGEAMTVVWRCGSTLPVDPKLLPSPEFVYQPGGESNLRVMDVSAGGARLRVPYNFEDGVLIEKGANMLCTFALVRAGTRVNLKVLVIGRVVSCQPVSSSITEIRLQFTHQWQGTDKQGLWVWGRLGQDGVAALKRWMDEDLPDFAGVQA